MQSTFVDATSHLQLCSTELLSHFVVVPVDSILTGGSTAPMTELLTLFLLIKNDKLSLVCLL